MSTTSTVLNKVIESFNFSVDKFPLSGPDNMSTPYYGLFRSDNSKAIGGGSVSDRYEPHTTDDVLALCEAVDTVFDGTANVSCHFNAGHYVKISPSKKKRMSIIGTDDNVWPEFMIRGGYGRTGGSFTCSMMLFVDMCKNMAELKSVAGTSVTMRHTSSLRTKMDDLIDQVSTLNDKWPLMAARINDMKNRQIMITEFLDRIYAPPTAEAAAKSVTMHKNRTTSILNRLLKERTKRGLALPVEGKVSGWELFNAVQGYVQHDAIRRGSLNTVAKIVAANRGPSAKVVAQAENLALSM